MLYICEYITHLVPLTLFEYSYLLSYFHNETSVKFLLGIMLILHINIRKCVSKHKKESDKCLKPNLYIKAMYMF